MRVVFRNWHIIYNIFFNLFGGFPNEHKNNNFLIINKKKDVEAELQIKNCNIKKHQNWDNSSTYIFTISKMH